jgi:hypothetical protein
VMLLLEAQCKVAACMRVCMAVGDGSPGQFCDKWCCLFRRELTTGERHCQLYIFASYQNRKDPIMIWLNGAWAQLASNDADGTCMLVRFLPPMHLHISQAGHFQMQSPLCDLRVHQALQSTFKI